MRFEFNTRNDDFFFGDFSQKKDKKYTYCCSVFAPIMNITANCLKTHNIRFNYEDIDNIIDKMVIDGKLHLNKGAYGHDGVNYVYDYIKLNAKKRGWKIPNLAIFTSDDEKELLEWIKRGYVVISGMNLKKEFVDDMKDGKIEKFDDYKNYTGNTYGHFANIGVWTRSFNDLGIEFILDNYTDPKNGEDFDRMVKINLKEFLNNFAMNTKYLFF